MAHTRVGVATLALAALALAAPVRADWTAYGGNPEHQFFTTERLTAPLGVLWKHATNVVAEPRLGGNRGGPIIVGNTVLFPSKNRLHAVDVETGELRWRAPAGDPNDPNIPQITATPATNGEFAFTPVADGRVVAYSMKDGTVAWEFQTGGPVRSSPTLVGNSLYFGSDDDFVYSVNARNGALLWKSNDRTGKATALTDNVVGSPSYYGGVIYVNTSDMKLWALQGESGRVLWSQRMLAPSVDVSPVAYNGRIYMASGSSMYQFRLRGGSHRIFPMQQFMEGDISSTPIITEKIWYVGDSRGLFHAIQAASGRPALTPDGQPWRVKLEGKPQGTPVMTADTLYVTTDRGFIYGIDPVRGRITWTYRTEAPKGIEPLFSYYAIRAPLAVSKGRLFVLGDDGTLTAMTPTAPDTEGPTITTPRPSRGTVLNGTPPLYMAAYLWDEGSGINPSTIELLLDGGPVDPDPKAYNDRTATVRTGWIYDPVRRLLSYQTQKPEAGQQVQPLANGPHKITVQAADWKGNLSVMEWNFVVDNSLPRGAVAVKTTPRPTRNANGLPGGSGPGYPGGEGGDSGYPGGPGGSGGGYPGMGGSGYPGMGGPGGPGGPGGTFRGGSTGGYTYGNRGQGGYGFGNRGGMGGYGQGGYGQGGYGQGGGMGGYGRGGGRGGYGRGGY